MGMYDNIAPVNVQNENFEHEHNGVVFQTKEFENDLSSYVIFNNTLYIALDNSDGQWLRHDEAVAVIDYSGRVDMLGTYECNDVEYSISYFFTFENGKLVGVEKIKEGVVRDNRKLAEEKPKTSGNRVNVTISLDDCDEDKTNELLDKFEDSATLDAVREALGEPLATIAYPSRAEGVLAMSGPKMRTLFSVVITEEGASLINTGSQAKSSKEDTGFRVILDEFSGFLSE